MTTSQDVNEMMIALTNGGVVWGFWKGTSLAVPTARWRVLAGAGEVLADVASDEKLREMKASMDTMEETIHAYYDAHSHEQLTQRVLLNGAFGEGKERETIVRWFSQLATLLKRGIVKNNNEFGWIKVEST